MAGDLGESVLPPRAARRVQRQCAWICSRDCSLDDALDRIRSVYVDDYDDSNAWDWYCVLELTRKGELFARSIEAQAQR